MYSQKKHHTLISERTLNCKVPSLDVFIFIKIWLWFGTDGRKFAFQYITRGVFVRGADVRKKVSDAAGSGRVERV